MNLGRSKTICAANVHGGKACPKRAFADTLKEDSAGNVVTLEGTLQAGGHFKAHCMLLIVEGTCAVVESVTSHFESKCWHGPESTTELFMDIRKASRTPRRLEECLSFRAGESGLPVLAWEREASSKASQVVSS
eukprot:1152075-Pelagomonas_calceolata.AAC.1